MTYIWAAVVGGLAICAELYWSKRYWFTVPAIGWWVARILADVGLALVMAALIRRVPASTFSAKPVIVGLLAGLTAPRVIARYPFPGWRGHNVNLVNIAYQRVVRDIVEDNLDAHSAEAQREYCNEVIVPATVSGDLPLSEVTKAFRDHIRGRREFSEVEQAEKLKFISDIVDDSGATDAEKVTTLFLKALEIGAYVSMEKLLKPLPRRHHGTSRALRQLWEFPTRKKNRK